MSRTHTTGWCHFTVEFPDLATAEQRAAEHLCPALIAAEDTGALHNWWHVRKGRTWRLRLHAAPFGVVTITAILDQLVAAGRIAGWSAGIYEPETTAFGGEDGMEIAHTLFHHDSHHLLLRASTPRIGLLGRRETAVLLCGTLLRGAGLDWYEQGDVWAKVAQLRPIDPSASAPPPARTAALARKMRTLMTADTLGLCTPSGALAGQHEWVGAFDTAGRALADLAHAGRLQRGLRAVLAHHVIFHANRAGLALGDQSRLAALALNTVFHAPDTKDQETHATTRTETG